MITYRPEAPEDTIDIEHLLELSFGPERLKKTVYKLRRRVAPVPELSLVVEEDGELRGSVRYWPVEVRNADPAIAPVPAVLLGPVAVDPAHRGRGMGIELLNRSIARAWELGHRLIILVGDPDYYKRVGFTRAGAEGLRLPGPVDYDRLLVRANDADVLNGLAGMISKVSKSRKGSAEPAAPRTEAS